MRHIQNAQVRALMDSSYYQALLDIIEEMKNEANNRGTIGFNEFETITLSIRRDERLLTLVELINKIEKHASNSKV